MYNAVLMKSFLGLFYYVVSVTSSRASSAAKIQARSHSDYGRSP